MFCLDEDTVLAWLAGELSGDTRRGLEAHVDTCAECRRLVSELAADDRAATTGPPPSLPSLGEPGSVIDHRWLLEEAVGRGGMGTVYRARDLTDGRIVAVKRVELDDARFEREARILAELAHPAIVRHIRDGVAENGSRYLVMEWLEGETLARRLGRGPLSIEDTITLARRIAEALGAAHASGVVHRDVKPSNLFLVDGRVDRVKVVDFGLARQRDGETIEARTRSGTLLGTPGYMAPEQARGERSVGPPADVFALGCVMYECLTGARAFPGGNVVAVLSNLLAGKSPRPRARRAETPRGLDDLVARMLASSPLRRPQDGSQLLAELAIIGSLRSLVRRSTVVRGAGLLAGIAALAGAVVVLRPRPSSSVHAAAPAPTARAITDVTLAPGTPAEAVAEYRAGIAAIRHAALEHARKHLEKALDLDPALAGAHLRLAIWADTLLTTQESRAHYKAAYADRTRLDPRDQELLSAVEPVFLVEPPNVAEAMQRLGALAARHPEDAELALLGVGVSSPKARPEEYDTVLALDPGFAYAWWSRANAQYRNGQQEMALASIDRCVEVAPDSSLCVLLRARIDAREGRCVDLERDARAVVALEDGGSYGYLHLANALLARGADRAAVEAALRARAIGIPDPKIRAQTELYERAEVAAAYGDFVETEKLARALADRMKDEPFIQDHVPWALLLIGAIEEGGDTVAAGRVADDFLRRRPAWRSVAIRPTDDPLPTMLAVARRAGRRTSEEEERGRTEWAVGWLAKLGNDNAGDIWMEEWARPARDERSLAAASAKMPEALAARALGPRPPGWIAQSFGTAYAAHAQTLKHPAEAAESLSRITHHCGVLQDPIAQRRSYLWRGQALEALHATSEACASYASAVAQWGHARPRSVTADAARSRMRALACPR